jgi:hypothetical protein
VVGARLVGAGVIFLHFFRFPPQLNTLEQQP